MLQDLRYAVRQLSKSPGLTAVVVATLALAIGACTAIFSVVDGVLLKPLGFPDPDRLVVLKEVSPPPASGPLAEAMVSPPAFLDWENLAKSYVCIAASADNSVNFTGRGEPLRLNAMEVTPRYFDVYGVKPALGRSFLPDEDLVGKNHVVVVSHSFWQRALGGAADVVGAKIQLEGESYTVIGVAQPGFGIENKNDLWLPIVFAEHPRIFSEVPKLDRTDHSDLDVVARLRAGVTASQADAEMKLVSAQLAAKYPDSLKGWSALARPMLAEDVRNVNQVLYTLLGAIGCVLLIACVNIANLLLARATARQREMSIRLALGSGRARLMRQLLVESLLLAVLGGAAGMLVAKLGLDALLAFAPSNLPRMAGIGIDSGALAFSFVLSIATGILFGFAPAWLAARTDLNETLKQGARGTTEGGARGRLRGTLVVLEVAVSLALLAATGLLVRSFARLAHVDPGFTAEHAATARLSLPQKKYGDAEHRIAFVNALLACLRALPGVDAASVSYTVPLSGFGLLQPFAIVGRPAPSGDRDLPYADYYLITPDYFRALGIRLVRGRAFAEQDNLRSTPVAIINETFARQQFHDQDPIGQRVRQPGSDQANGREIVGIVSDVAQYGADKPIPCQLYYPYAQDPGFYFNITARTTGPASAILGSLRSAVSSVDRDQPVNRLRTFEDMLADSIARQRFAMLLLAVFSAVALVIAVIGIYGVIAYSVSQRTAEIGIRMALGAQPADVLRLVLGYGARLVGLGLFVGLAAALACGRLIESMLFQTSARDPLALGAVAALLAAAAAVACLIPARRATRIDPIIALRAE